MDAAIEFIVVDLVYADFLVSQDFVATRESIINALNLGTGYEEF